MKQPERLLQSGSPRARELLGSLSEDVPPDPVGGQERLLRALDLPSDAGSGGATKTTAAASRRSSVLLTLAGLVGVGLVAGVVFHGVGTGKPAPSTEVARRVAATTSETSVVASELTPPPATVAPNQDNPAPAAPLALGMNSDPNAPPTTPSIDVHALETASPPSRGAAPNLARPSQANARAEGGKSPSPSASVATITAAPAGAGSDELQLLERAQSAASHGHTDEALALVATHRRDFPHGRFLVEMSVVEIEALARDGRIEEAAKRGERFLESNPGSPYTRRVEAVIRRRDRKEQTR